MRRVRAKKAPAAVVTAGAAATNPARIDKSWEARQSLPCLHFLWQTNHKPELSQADSIPFYPGNLSKDSKPSSTLLAPTTRRSARRSEEHTSELQSPCNLVCRLLL